MSSPWWFIRFPIVQPSAISIMKRLKTNTLYGIAREGLSHWQLQRSDFEIRDLPMIRRPHLAGLEMELVQMVPMGIKGLHGPRANTIPVFWMLLSSEANEGNRSFWSLATHSPVIIAPNTCDSKWLLIR